MKVEEIKQGISYLHATKQHNLADIAVKEKVLKGVDSMHNLLTETCKAISQMRDYHPQTLVNKAQQYLQDTKEKS